jgi:hypothetical protein
MPLIPINGMLTGFVSGKAYQAYTLCFASYGSTVSSGTLDWGDGHSTDVGASSSGISHGYLYGGAYTITLTCRDAAGYNWTQTTMAQIDGPPAPSPAPPATTPPGANGAAASGKSTGTAASSSGQVNPGSTVLLATKTLGSGCVLGASPDRRCSPGAYYSGLSTRIICSSSFRTSSIRHVSEATKHQVEAEYGMRPAAYGSTLEIDHIVSLELGGSNDIANLFPERAPGFRAKDKLENKLHALVCAGSMTLLAAQQQIASDWQALYAKVFGAPALT